jgi:hypothetical protein
MTLLSQRHLPRVLHAVWLPWIGRYFFYKGFGRVMFDCRPIPHLASCRLASCNTHMESLDDDCLISPEEKAIFVSTTSIMR